MKKWVDITSDPRWAEADATKRDLVRYKYFDKYVSPKILKKYNGDQTELKRVRDLFLTKTEADLTAGMVEKPQEVATPEEKPPGGWESFGRQLKYEAQVQAPKSLGGAMQLIEGMRVPQSPEEEKFGFGHGMGLKGKEFVQSAQQREQARPDLQPYQETVTGDYLNPTIAQGEMDPKFIPTPEGMPREALTFEGKAPKPFEYKDLLKPYKIGQTMGQTIPTAVTAAVAAVGGAVVAGPVGGGAAAFTVMFGLEGGSAYRDAIESGLSETDAVNVGVAVGVINGVIEQMSIAPLFKSLGIGKKVTKEITKKIAEDLIKRQSLKNIPKAVLEQFLTEGLEEVLQEANGIYQMNKYLPEDQRPSLQEIIERLVQSFYGGALAGGGIGGAAGTYGVGKARMGLKTLPDGGVKSEVEFVPSESTPKTTESENKQSKAISEETLPEGEAVSVEKPLVAVKPKQPSLQKFKEAVESIKTIEELEEKQAKWDAAKKSKVSTQKAANVDKFFKNKRKQLTAVEKPVEVKVEPKPKPKAEPVVKAREVKAEAEEVFDKIHVETQEDIALVLYRELVKNGNLEDYGESGMLASLQDQEDPPMIKKVSVDPKSLDLSTRSISDAAVKKYSSMNMKGNPPPVVLRDGKLLEGGHRVAVAIKLGKKSIDAVDIGGIDWESYINGSTFAEARKTTKAESEPEVKAEAPAEPKADVNNYPKKNTPASWAGWLGWELKKRGLTYEIKNPGNTSSRYVFIKNIESSTKDKTSGYKVRISSHTKGKSTFDSDLYVNIISQSEGEISPQNMIDSILRNIKSEAPEVKEAGRVTQPNADYSIGGRYDTEIAREYSNKSKALEKERERAHEENRQSLDRALDTNPDEQAKYVINYNSNSRRINTKYNKLEKEIRQKFEKEIRQKFEAEVIDLPPVPEPPEEVEPTKTEDKVKSLSDRINKDHLSQGKKITSKDLSNMSDEVYGGSRAEGTYEVKDTYDALEMSVNKHIRENIDRFNITDDPEQSLNNLNELLELLPKQTVRSEESIDYQQFSTPWNYAYVVNWVANVTKNDVVLEPSAGTGNIAVFAKNAGAEVIANELTERRRTILEDLGFDKVTGEDAEQIDNIYPSSIKPTVVVMNPPFSSAGERGVKGIAVAERHIEQAFKRLEPNGRLVAIVGAGLMGDARAPLTDYVKRNGIVRASVTVDRKVYEKLGTSFPTRILVIDKVSPADQLKTRDSILLPSITGHAESISDLAEMLKGIRDDRKSPSGKLPLVESGVTEKTEGSGREDTERGLSIQPPVRDVATGKQSATVSKKPVRAGGEVAGAVRTDVEGTTAVSVGERGSDIQQEGVRGEQSRRSSVAPVTGVKRAVVQDIELPEEEIGEDVGNSLYETYRPKGAIFEGAQAHPTPLVESAAMAAISAPEVHYVPNLPEDIIKSGKISDAQLEDIARTGQAHEEFLPNGERRGFLTGDGTGVGKGRECAGVILDNWRRGRKKAVWISERQDLVNDAKRDFDDLGWKDAPLFNIGTIKADSDIKRSEGIAFMTYNLLQGNVKSEEENKPDIKRIDQLAAFLGDDFEGVIVFDEAHNMGNSIKTKGSSSTPAKKALAGIELQDRFPKARIKYVSATGATEVKNLAFAKRLGLWGVGRAFSNVSEFIGAIASSGLSAMEKVAGDLKAMGLYVSRGLSYKGVEIDALEHPLSDKQTEDYNSFARAWQIILKNMRDALKLTGADSKSKGNAEGAFWGAHQRFFNQIITSFKLDTVIKDIEKQLESGNSVVIQLVNTQAANLKRALIDAGEDIEDFDMTPRQALMQYLENAFPVNQYEEYVDENGTTQSRQVLDSNGNPVKSREAESMRDSLLDEIGSLKVAEGPLELLIHHFGYENISEVTGRNKRIIWKDGKPEKAPRSVKFDSEREVKAFNSGKKRILVFSMAGATGSSYHADKTFKNNQKRIHYLLQPGWRADKAIQGMGRTHRSNQLYPPYYRLVTTNLKAEKRFISSIARRIEQLGALGKGQRQTGGQGMFDAMDNLENEYAVLAMQNLFKNIQRGVYSGEGLSAREFQDMSGLVLVSERGQNVDVTKIPITRFLNRLLSLETDMMDYVFELFFNNLMARIEDARASGTLDVGVEDIKADKIEILNGKIVYTDPESGAMTKHVELKVSNKPVTRSFDDIVSGKAKNFKVSDSDEIMFFMSGKTEESKKPVAVVRLSESNKYKVVSPYGNVRYVDSPYDVVAGTNIYQDELYKDYRANGKDSKLVKEAWDNYLKTVPEFIETRHHLLTGITLPIWDRLPTAKNLKVNRAKVGKRRLLGITIPTSDVTATLAKLGANRELTGNVDDIISEIMDNGEKISLVNGWVVKRGVVAGEQRPEIVGPEYGHIDEIKSIGGIVERIQGCKTRFFLPVGAKLKEVFQKLIDLHPVVGYLDRKANEVLHDDSGSIPIEMFYFMKPVKERLGDAIEAVRQTFQTYAGRLRGGGQACNLLANIVEEIDFDISRYLGEGLVLIEKSKQKIKSKDLKNLTGVIDKKFETEETKELGKDPDVKDFVKAWKRVTDQTFYRAKALGVTILMPDGKRVPIDEHYIAEYIRHELTPEARKGLGVDGIIRKDAIEYLIKTKQAENEEDAIGLLTEWLKNDPTVVHYGSLEKPRLAELPADLYEQNFAKLLPGMLKRSAHFLGVFKHFGEGGSKVKRILTRIAIQNPELYAYAIKGVEYITSGGDRPTAGSKLFRSGVGISANIGLSSPTSGFKNLLLGDVKDVQHYGLRRLITGYIDLIHNPKIKELTMSVAAIESGVHDIEASSIAKWNPGLMDPSERANRIKSVARAVAYAKDCLAILNGHKVPTWESKLQLNFRPRTHARHVLKDVFHLEDIDEIIVRGHFLKPELKRIAFYGQAAAQGTTTVSQLPLWMSNRYGKSLTLFYRMAYRASADVYKNAVKPAMKGNLGPLVFFLAGSALAGEAMYALASLLYRRDHPKKDDPLWERLYKDLVHGEGAALLSNYLEGYGSTWDTYKPVLLKNAELVATNIYEWATGKKFAGQAMFDIANRSIAIYGTTRRAVRARTKAYADYDYARGKVFNWKRNNGLIKDVDYELSERSPYYRGIREAVVSGDRSEMRAEMKAATAYMLHSEGLSRKEIHSRIRYAISSSAPIPISEKDKPKFYASIKSREDLNRIKRANRDWERKRDMAFDLEKSVVNWYNGTLE